MTPVATVLGLNKCGETVNIGCVQKYDEPTGDRPYVAYAHRSDYLDTAWPILISQHATVEEAAEAIVAHYETQGTDRSLIDLGPLNKFRDLQYFRTPFGYAIVDTVPDPSRDDPYGDGIEVFGLLRNDVELLAHQGFYDRFMDNEGEGESFDFSYDDAEYHVGFVSGPMGEIALEITRDDEFVAGIDSNCQS